MKQKDEALNSADFIKSLKDGNGEALTLVVKRYNKELFRACIGLGFRSDVAEELAQRVWLTFLDIIARFEGRSSIRTFLFGIMYKKAMEMRREEAKINRHDDVDDVMESRFNDNGQWVRRPISPEKFALALETEGIIADCLKPLPTMQKMAFIMKEVDGDDSKSICNALEISATNLRVLLYRAKNRLRECIEKKSKGEKR